MTSSHQNKEFNDISLKQNKCQNTLDRIALNEDGLVQIIGQFGRWQLMVCLVIALIKPQSAWIKLGVVFLTPSTGFTCVDFGDNSTVVEVMNSTCYPGCEQYEYDTSPMQSTIISEWDLVCERKWMASFTQSILMFGTMVGSVLFGFISDRFGRKLTVIGGSALTVVLMILTPFVNDYWLFTSIRFLLGVLNGGVVVASAVTALELISPRHRELAGVLLYLPYFAGQSTLSAFAYYFRTWETYLMSLGVTALISLFFIIMLPESPRWLISVGRVEEAMKVLVKATKWNRLSTANISMKIDNMRVEMQSKKVFKPKTNYLDLFRTPTLRLRSAACCVVWAVVGLCFYGVNQYISIATTNIFASVAVAGMLQIPANILGIYFNKRFGRKRTIIVSLCLGGVLIVTLGFISKTHWISFPIGVLGVSSISVSSLTINIFTSELFPTTVRSMAMGMSSATLRVGAIVAPFVANLATTSSWLPEVIMGVAPLLAALVVTLLPETRGIPLDTV